MMLSADLGSSTQKAKDINVLSNFLANPQILHSDNPSTSQLTPSTLVVAPSAVLHQAFTVFSLLQFYDHHSSSPLSLSKLKVLILTGGVGHSTAHLCAAVLKHPRYRTLPSYLPKFNHSLEGLTEARILYLLFIHYHDGENVMKFWSQGDGLKVLVEEASTNCGANAKLSREMLERKGVRLGGGVSGTEDVVIVQDPTMSLRTKASFEKVYEKDVRGGNVRFWCWPTFVPCVKNVSGEISWDTEKMERVDTNGMWEMKRFNGLILGEIERLRDDEHGYGPKGMGFIAHVDVPVEVENAWRRLKGRLDIQR